MFFASDNAGPVAPEIMAAIVAENEGYAMAYGHDRTSKNAISRIREVFEAPDAVVFFVPTGTAANALSLGTIAKPWDAIFCSRDAHIEVHECGAAEFYTGGAKLVALDGVAGKIDPQALQEAMERRGTDPEVETTRGPLSLTQATDLGAVYTLGELKKLTEIAHSYGSVCHMDGARFANALVSLDASPAEMSWKSGIDVLSFGGTKNGLMGAEAVIFFRPDLVRDFEKRRLRGAHMASKQRFQAAQYMAYLQDGLWRDLARRANRSAEKLEVALKGVPHVSVLHERQANIIFAEWPRSAHVRARNSGAAYYMIDRKSLNEGPGNENLAARLVCNWASTDADIEQFIALLRS